MTRYSLLCGALLASSSLSAPAAAQAVFTIAPPQRLQVDGNGVDHVTGNILLSTTELTIGPSGPGGLSVIGYHSPGPAIGQAQNWDLVLYVNGQNYAAGLGDTSDGFIRSGNNFSSTSGNGSTLTLSGSTYTYTSSSGIKIIYDYVSRATGEGTVIRASKVIYPTGDTDTLTWETVTYCTNSLDNCQGGTFQTRVRLDYVTNSDGYQLVYSYGVLGTPVSAAQGAQWSLLNRIIAVNLASPDCVVSGPTCTSLSAWPFVKYTLATTFPQGGGSLTVNSVSDALGRTARYTNSIAAGPSFAETFSVRRPSSTTDDLIYAIDNTTSTQQIASVTRDGQLWNYASSLSGNVRTIIVTNPLGQASTTTADISIAQILTSTDALNRTTTYTYSPVGLLLTATAPENNRAEYGYDTRGNITLITSIAKPGSGIANVTTSAVFPSDCANPVTCNKPTSTTDARGNVTTYTYDPTHGGVLTVTAPAVNGISPQTRYSYTALQAYYQNASGSIVASGVPTYRLTGTSSCRTLASCVGTADETRATVAYGSPGAANNLLPTSTSTGAGDGSVSATTTVAYDGVGNVFTADGPLDGSADITRLHYDADRELIGTVGPDPDGGGPLRNRATRTTYNADGNVVLTEQGTVASQSDTDWAGFSTLQQVATSYDNAARKVQDSAQAAGTTYAVAQYSYDAVGRLDCSAQRMNPGAFGGLPDACTLGAQGSFGPDRISRNSYDAAGQLSKTTSAYGVSGLQRDDVTYSYTANGKVGTAADAKGNITRYAYDGFDRLLTTTYPNPTGGDYEQLAYDPSGNVISRQLRDGSSIIYNYDALNRLTGEILPAGSDNSNPTFAYDLAGRLLSATNGNPVFHTGVSYAYDALGRQVSATSTFNDGGNETKTSQYDLAGHRTRLAWPDGFFVTYDYDSVGEMTAIHENGAGVLASFGYDDLGRRTTRSLANGATASYAYDALSRLTSLAISGTSSNTTTLGGYSPAGQIGSRSLSSDNFVWAQGYDVSRPYQTNSLNQYTSVGGDTPSYDRRGNLTASGGSTFAYDTENDLTAWSGGSFAHNALHQMVFDTSTSTRLDYDGSDLTSEYDGSNNMLRRYVFGPTTDEPIVWYEGAGTSDKRYLDQDERGSVTRITDGSGATLAINSYDEFGIPASTNMGRFQYTGQAWIPALGMYYYKARIYSPTLGRFMQTDPIGYGDGMNWYNYADSNPINGTDSSGLTTNDDDYAIKKNGSPGDPVTGSRLPGVIAAGLNLSGYLGATSSSGAMGGADGGDSVGSAENGGFYFTRLTFSDGHTWDTSVYWSGSDNFGGFSSPQSPLAGNTPVALDPLTGNDIITVRGIAHSSNVTQAMNAAWNATLLDGLERGFFIYSGSPGSYYPGRTVVGTPTSLPSLAASHIPVNPLAGQFDLTVAYFHDHPGNFVGVGSADIDDRNFGRYYGAITIIESVEGMTIGR